MGEDTVLQLQTLKSNVKPLLIPSGVITAVVILFIIFTPIIYGQITDGLREIEEANRSKEQLEQKLLSLREIQNDVLPLGSNTVLALPDRNPILYKWNVIRTSVERLDGLTINGFATNRIRTNKDTDYQSMTVSISFTGGNMDQIMQLLKDSSETIPLSTVNLFVFDTQGGENNYSVALSTYWSELPTTITKISEPIDALNSDEMETLSGVSSLRQPEFVQLQRTEYPNRISPFQ